MRIRLEKSCLFNFDSHPLPSFRFITHDDMSAMLCTSDGKMDATVMKMWHDGLKEIQCKADDKIAFEEFKMFLKGAVPKDAMLSDIRSGDATRRNSSRQLVASTFVLQAVPEGFSSLQCQDDDEAPSYSDLRPLPPRAMVDRATSVVLSASGSMLLDEDDDYDLPGTSVRSDLLLRPESDAFRKRQDFRMSLLHASKLFDQKRQARQPFNVANPAGLTMVAGGRRPSLDASCLRDATNISTASKRSGRRNRHNRKKTKSDLSLLIQSVE